MPPLLPPPPPPPPWQVAAEAARLDLTAEIEASKGTFGEPFTIAPDVWYGATPRLTLGIVHSRYATTGFRGSEGGGLCVAGSHHGCAHVYDNVGAEIWGTLATGAVSLGVGGGAHVLSFDRDLAAGKLGVRARIAAGTFSLYTAPSVMIEATHRDTAPDLLYVPVALGVKTPSGITLSIGTGVKAHLDDLHGSWTFPLGASLSYPSGPLVVGASFTYGALASAADNPPPPARAVEGVDVRVIQVWLSYTFRPARPAPREAPRKHQPVKRVTS